MKLASWTRLKSNNLSKEKLYRKEDYDTFAFIRIRDILVLDVHNLFICKHFSISIRQ